MNDIALFWATSFLTQFASLVTLWYIDRGGDTIAEIYREGGLAAVEDNLFKYIADFAAAFYDGLVRLAQDIERIIRRQ